MRCSDDFKQSHVARRGVPTRGSAMTNSTRVNSIAAWSDITGGAARWQLWGSMGWQDILQRYRRSVLGPLWISVSMTALLLTLGLLYGKLFGHDMSTFLPYLCAGLIVWNLLSISFAEGSTAYIDAAGFIKQLRIPYSTFVMRVVWRNLLVAFHNALVFLPLALFFGLPVGWATLLVIPGLVLVLANSVWVGLGLALISVRYRDVPQIVMAMLQPLFFLTPIMWTLDQLDTRPGFVAGNPLYHWIEVMRAPMLGQVPAFESWCVASGTAIAGFAICTGLYARYRAQVSYWI